MTSHVVVLPLSKESNNEVASELSSQDLGEEINVRDESTLENDWNVGRVEKLDWIWLSETSHLSATQTKFNSETLEVDYHHSHDHCSDQIAKIWSVLSVECLL
jgi:hypothetical protein